MKQQSAGGNNKRPFSLVSKTEQYASFSQHVDNDQTMSMTREELDARLSALADRSDARARETELKAEARLARFEERIDLTFGELRRELSEVKTEMKSTRQEVHAQKWQILGGVFGIGVAVVLGIAAFNATVLSNMVSSFDSGRQSAEALSIVSQRLDKISERLDKQATPPAAPASK